MKNVTLGITLSVLNCIERSVAQHCIGFKVGNENVFFTCHVNGSVERVGAMKNLEIF